MVKIINDKKSRIDHVIYIKVFSDGTVYYLIVSIDDFLKTTNNETASPELAIFFEEQLDMTFQEGSILKYLNLRIFQYTLDFSVYHTDHIMEIIN